MQIKQIMGCIGQYIINKKSQKIDFPLTQCSTKLTGDTVNFSHYTNKSYQDIIDNMTNLRSKIKIPDDSLLVEEIIANYKNDFALNKKIFANIHENSQNLPHKTLKELSELDTIIQQSVLPRNITLYRGAKIKDFGVANISRDDFLKRFYKKNRLFKIPIYPETSLDKNIGVNFAQKHGNDGILFKIH